MSLIFFFLIFIFNCKVLTYNTYLQTMYDTYATNRTILFLQKKKTYLQCEILTLLTILYSTYNTKLAILTYNEMLTLLKVLYSTLYIYKTATCTTYITDYIRYKNRKKEKGGGAGKYGRILVNCSSNSKEKKEIKDIFSADSRKLALYTLKVEARKIGRECLVGRKV